MNSTRSNMPICGHKTKKGAPCKNALNTCSVHSRGKDNKKTKRLLIEKTLENKTPEKKTPEMSRDDIMANEMAARCALKRFECSSSAIAAIKTIKTIKKEKNISSTYRGKLMQWVI